MNQDAEDCTYQDIDNFTCGSCEDVLSKPKVPVTPWKSAKKREKSPTRLLEVSPKKMKMSSDKIESKKPAPAAKSKFTPWFSDDEQLEDDDDCVNSPKRLRTDRASC